VHIVVNECTHSRGVILVHFAYRCQGSETCLIHCVVADGDDPIVEAFAGILDSQLAAPTVVKNLVRKTEVMEGLPKMSRDAIFRLYLIQWPYLCVSFKVPK